MTKKPITPTQVRHLILDCSYRANTGHIGSCLSVVEILTTLYNHILNLPTPTDPNRDRFILSKGHAALTLYSILQLQGRITKKTLRTFHQDHSLLGVHPDYHLPGIDFSTGSLGQGITYAAGAALAAKLQNHSRRIYCLISDAECNQGSVWEAAQFAAHHHLNNLTVIVDNNGQQAFGYTQDVLHLPKLKHLFQNLGWHTQQGDGHNLTWLKQAYQKTHQKKAQPHLIIANTTFGKGVSFMHNQIDWHYLPLTKAQYDQAKTALSIQKPTQKPAQKPTQKPTQKQTQKPSTT